MKRGVQVAALVASHSVAFCVAAASLAGYRVSAVFRAAAREPLNRIGMAMTSGVDKQRTSTLDADLSALSRTIPPPTADVIRLAVLLEQGRIEEARVVCTGLAWSRCDRPILDEMRKSLVR